MHYYYKVYYENIATMEGRLVWSRDNIIVKMWFLDRWTCIWHNLRRVVSQDNQVWKSKISSRSIIISKDSVEVNPTKIKEISE